MFFPKLGDTFTFGGIVNTEQKVNEAIQEDDKLKDEERFSETLEGMIVSMVSEGAEASPFLSLVISCMNDSESNPEIDFDQLVRTSETNDDEDEMEGEIPEELINLVTEEDKWLLPNQEELGTLNLGTDEEKKEDMPGLDTDIVVHKLPTKPDCRPVQQKLRRMRTDMLLKIREEVQKQLDAGFLKVAKYPEWVANIVLVPKKDGKVRMCVDYRDLNKASPKDNFPLPHIDTLVDNTTGHSWFSFMDGFSGYN
ncbi:hypothetical protein V6N12_042898 [Hibiscus sabdariffa]|uniref:Uncharacterized protein n=1 Tax=Hibiscus sabdariffa TaxID=183260 RepID=A0ABR2BFB7_9ROSI